MQISLGNTTQSYQGKSSYLLNVQKPIYATFSSRKDYIRSSGNFTR